MSVEFREQGFPGWYQDDPNKPTILRANIAQLTSRSGGISPIVAEFDYANGSIQYYEVRGGIGFNGPRIPLFTQNASGTRAVQNQGNLNELKPEDIARIEESVKSVAFKANQTLASNAEKETLKNSQYYKSQGNVAEASPQEDGEGGTAPNLPSPELLEQFNTPSESKIISTGSGLRYPLDTATTDQDVIKFQALEFVNRGLGSRLPESSGGVFTIPEPETRNATGPGGKSEGPVFIAIQSPISDQNSVEWGSGNISAIDAAIFNVSLPLVLSDDESAKTNAKDIYKGLNNQTNRIQKFLAGQAASINNILARTDNVALNPNLELLFQGPQLRPFNFQFKMSAREKSEADTIKSIIKYFKYHMAVRKETGLFLKAPHVFSIEYLHKNIKHPGINEIKRCALTNCSVDYTPLGSYATYEDGTMVSYTLSLQFQELVPIYDDDYKDHSIGF